MKPESLHTAALATLRAWEAPSPAQAVLRERYLDHLTAHPDGLFRSCVPDHLTASTLVVSPDGDRVLLTLHAAARRWFQLGGHIEPGDASLEAAALREASEESGVAGLRLEPGPLHLAEHAVPFCRGNSDASEIHHLDVRFLAVAPPGAVPTISEESLDVAWWPVDALPEADPDLSELVSLARRRIA